VSILRLSQKFIPEKWKKNDGPLTHVRNAVRFILLRAHFRKRMGISLNRYSFLDKFKNTAAVAKRDVPRADH